MISPDGSTGLLPRPRSATGRREPRVRRRPGCPAGHRMGRQPFRRLDAHYQRSPAPEHVDARRDLRYLRGGTAARPAHRRPGLGCARTQGSRVGRFGDRCGGHGCDAAFPATRRVAGGTFDRRRWCGSGNDLRYRMGFRLERSGRCGHRRGRADRRIRHRTVRRRVDRRGGRFRRRGVVRGGRGPGRGGDGFHVCSRTGRGRVGAGSNR